MSILKPTDHAGVVVWLGRVDGSDGIAAEAVGALDLDWGGPVGDIHHGSTRAACVRVRRQHAQGTEIRNVRQLSIVCEAQLDEIARRLGVPEIRPEWLGATAMLRGIPDFTRLPPASRLIAKAGPALVVDTENAPCRHPAARIEAAHPGRGRDFPKLAQGLRGVTAWVERPGRLALGDALALHVPAQPAWAGG